MTRPGFARPDFSLTLDVAAEIARCSKASTVKGMYMETAQRRIRALGSTPRFNTRVAAFKDYPTTSQMELLAQWAQLAHPDVPAREGLRRVGHRAYEDLTSSLAGRVIFGVLGSDIPAITRLIAKGYAISGHPQRAALLEQGERHSLVRLEEIDIFMDSYQVGVLEGVLHKCGADGAVYLRVLAPRSCEMFVEWR